jgi:uroporphyrinogen III methyltransferase/synthase
MPLQTPAALVQWGTETYQRTVEGTLENVLERGKEEGLQPPVVAVFGPVVELRHQIQWFDNRPLHGKRVLVTCAREQAGSLSDLITDAGGEPVELSTIQIAPPSDGSLLQNAARGISSYQWIVLTSANAVDALFQALDKEGLDTRALAGIRVAAIGPATADALARYGVHADCVPVRYVSEALVDELKDRVQPGDTVLHPRAESGREVVVDGLSALGATVQQVAAYRTVVPEGIEERARELLTSGQIDVVTFASSSSVRNLVELLSGDITPLSGVTVACIGPITEGTARELGLQVQVQTTDHTIPGLVFAMIDHFSAA